MAQINDRQLNVSLPVENIVPKESSAFESSVGNWLTYADAAGTQPVDGTGGSSSLSLDITTTAAEVLNGRASLKMSKGAVNDQGEGASLDLSVPNFIKGQPAMVRFSLKASANFDFGTAFDSSDPSDVTVYLYDVTNSKLIQPYPYSLISNGQFEGMFQVPSDCDDLRLILHVTTTNALAWDLFIDDVEITQASNIIVSADSDWQSYTPTFTGLGSVTGINMQYRKVGASIEVQGRFTAGTGTATEARMSLPAGLTSLSTLGVLIKVGSGSTTEIPTAAYSLAILCEPSVSYVTFGATSSAASEFSKRQGTSTTLSGQTIAVNASIPIQGWTSGQVTAASANLNAPVVLTAYKNGGATNADTTIASWTAATKDTVGAFNLTTGEYTVRVPGDYHVEMHARRTADAANALDIRKNGTVVISGAQFSSSSSKYVAGILPDLKVGDVITLTFSVTASTVVSNNTANYLSIYKVETSNRVYSTRVAYLKDVKANNTSGGTATSGSYQTRTLNTISGDTSFISLSANQFTLQPGTYNIYAICPAAASGTNAVGEHKAKLRNITDSTDTIIGSNAEAQAVSGAAVITNSIIEDVFSITSAKVFEIQHRVETTYATSGFGFSMNFGDSEVYTQVKIEKVL